MRVIICTWMVVHEFPPFPSYTSVSVLLLFSPYSWNIFLFTCLKGYKICYNMDTHVSRIFTHDGLDTVSGFCTMCTNKCYVKCIVTEMVDFSTLWSKLGEFFRLTVNGCESNGARTCKTHFNQHAIKVSIALGFSS